MATEPQPIPSSEAVYFNLEDGNNKPVDQSVVYIQEGLAKQARSAFVVKVYFLLTLELALTFGMCLMSQYVESYRNFQLDYGWFLVFPVLFLVAIMSMVFCVPKAREFPLDMVMLLFFILSFGYIVSYSCSVVQSQVEGPVVLIAVCITIAITIVITLYAAFAKINYNALIATLLIVSVTMILVFMVAIFSLTPIMVSIYCGLAVIIYGIYLVIITKLILGGELGDFPMDNYIIASLFLYIYIIKMFLMILRIVANSKR